MQLRTNCGRQIAKLWQLGVCTALWMMFGVALSFAAELRTPVGDILLTVSGEIGNTNVGDTAQFDSDMLTAMPVTTVVTSTPWTNGLAEFKGVALADLLDTVAPEGTVLRALAHNGYIVDIPTSDARDSRPIIAYMINGERMGVRTKGPLWVVYPFDSLSGDQELFYNRSIWQLRHIEVVLE